MWNKFINSKFCSNWGSMLLIIFSPGFFISAIVTCVSLYLSVFYKTNVPFSNTMTIIGSIFGGVSGAFFKDGYDKVSGKNILEKKGRSALRNLRGIGTQLVNIENWVIEFSKRTKKLEDKRTLDEINRHIATIDLNISASVEDWVDIVPELKEKTEKAAELDKKYKDLLQSYVYELVENRQELVKSKNEKRGEELKKKILDLEKQIKDVRKERPTVISSGGGGYSGSEFLFASSPYRGTVFASALNNNQKCINCGKKFIPDYSSNIYSIGDTIYCPDCRENGGSSVSSVKK
jgi:hypothetical protein